MELLDYIRAFRVCHDTYNVKLKAVQFESKNPNGETTKRKEKER